MEKVRDGAIGVLTHQDQVVFVSLPVEDTTSKDNGGKEKRERVKGDRDWVLLTAGMLGFVSGGVKSDKPLAELEEADRKKILKATLVREAKEEFDLELELDELDEKRDGIIEQLRYDQHVTFLLWVVSRVIIEENQLLKLKEKTEVVLVKETELADFLAKEKNKIRPAAQQALVTAYNL